TTSSSFVRLLVSCFLTYPATSEISTLSLHDALPIFATANGRSELGRSAALVAATVRPKLNNRHHPKHLTAQERADIMARSQVARSEEHTSELQSRENLVCRLLLEKKKKKTERHNNIR